MSHEIIVFKSPSGYSTIGHVLQQSERRPKREIFDDNNFYQRLSRNFYNFSVAILSYSNLKGNFNNSFKLDNMVDFTKLHHQGYASYSTSEK